MLQFTEALQTARKAAAAGAEIIRKRFGDTSNARIKSETEGLVTDTDLEAENAIFEVLTKETSYTILSEESGLLNERPGLKWVVDPVDGTNNFARSLPMFAVSIGLMDGNEFLAGVINDPVLHTEYYAEKGKGAFCNGEKIILPKINKEFTPRIFLNHGYKETDRNNYIVLAKRLAQEYDTLKLNATAIELCYVATGSSDGFIGSGDKLWDYAAGVVITTEAGCKFTDWRGNPWNGKENHLLFARPEFHEELVEIIRDLQR